MPDVDIGVDIGDLSCYESSPHVPRYPPHLHTVAPEPLNLGLSRCHNREVACTFLPPYPNAPSNCKGAGAGTSRSRLPFSMPQIANPH